jgi:hypothetical protein
MVMRSATKQIQAEVAKWKEARDKKKRKEERKHRKKRKRDDRYATPVLCISFGRVFFSLCFKTNILFRWRVQFLVRLLVRFIVRLRQQQRQRQLVRLV